MATWTLRVLFSIPITRLSTMIVMLQRCSRQLLLKHHLILHVDPEFFRVDPEFFIVDPEYFLIDFFTFSGCYFPPRTFLPVREDALHPLIRQA